MIVILAALLFGSSQAVPEALPDADAGAELLRSDRQWTTMADPLALTDDYSPRITIDLSWFSTGWYRVRGGALVKWNGRGWSIVTLQSDAAVMEAQ